MPERNYRILVARTMPALFALQRNGWTILGTTVREFSQLDTDDDHGLGDIGAVFVQRSGWIALAYSET
jgi:hypothetical protein